MMGGIQKRINLVSIGVVLASTLFLGAYFIRQETAALSDELDKRMVVLLNGMATSIEYPVLVGDLERIGELVEGIVAQGDVVYCCTKDLRGECLAESGSQTGADVRFYEGSVITTRVLEPDSDEMILGGGVAVEDTIGTIHLSVSLAGLNQKMDGNKRTVAVVIVITILLASAIWAFMLRLTLVGPIAILVKGIERIAGGDLGYQVPVERDDEIGRLATSFNRMTVELSSSLVSKQYVDNILQSMTDSLIVLDSEGMIKRVNRAALELLGYAEPGLINQAAVSLLPSEERECGWLIGCSQGKKACNVETYFMSKSGVKVPMLLSCSMLQGDDGAIEGRVWVAQDIRERKKAERALRDQNARTEQLLASIPSLLMAVGADGRLLHWNTPSERTFGIRAQDIMGASFWKCGIELNWERIKEAVERCRESRDPVQLDDLTYVRPNGKSGVLTLTINPYGGRKEQTGFLLLGEDITERRILEHQLSQAQKLESIGQLAAGIAHEINTPIQYVGDNVQFLGQAFEELCVLLCKHERLLQQVKGEGLEQELVAEIDSEAEELDIEGLREEIPSAIDAAQEGANRVAQIVAAMKAYSHPGTEEMTACDMNQAIENVTVVSRNEWKYVADMVMNFDPSLCLVNCFLGEINQVILNLIVNAAHAIKDVVEVEEGKEGPKGTITITTRRDGEFAEIRVCDTGGGIPEEIRGKVFDPFFTTKEVGQGTGQGLTLCHSAMEKHAGTITFETRENEGTTFIIRIPLEGRKAQAA
ncbi:MAG: PAS domain S-box protein [Candidatus Eisenbacteria sp.]|nr:PAS domain S-box protein [Candidatus Eisenbacteria bacterium]